MKFTDAPLGGSLCFCTEGDCWGSFRWSFLQLRHLRGAESWGVAWSCRWKQLMPDPLRLCPLRTVMASCIRRNEALAAPPLDNAPKVYPPKIQQLVHEIAGLTLLEVSELNELLKKTLKIQDVGMMPMGAVMPGVGGAQVAAQAVEEEDAPVKKEKTQFTVKLTEFSTADKVKLIKEVKNCMQGLNLVQAKKLVESLPQEIKANVSKEEAEKMKLALEAAGGKVLLE